MSLYAISTEMNAILDAILDGGADSPEAQDALNQHLAGLDAALEDKAERYACLIRELELRGNARAEEAKRIKRLADADHALSDRLKDRLKEAMEQAGRTAIDTPRFRLRVAGVGGKQAMEVDASCLPQWEQPFVTTVVEPNREAIRIALESGAEIPGCRLLPRGTSLRIK